MRDIELKGGFCLMSKQEQDKVTEIYKLIEEANALIDLSKNNKNSDQSIGATNAKATQ